LAIGIPGKSNAFAISRRLGLDQEIVDRGQALLSSHHVRVEDLDWGDWESSRAKLSRTA
jgi:Mismatch repair ATPase (MutS family)